MRRVVGALLLVLGGCAFNPSGLEGGVGPTDDAPGSLTDAQRPDGTPSPIDARIDAPQVPIDAPPCGDIDHDGICDDQDDWDCGATKPSVIFPGDLGSRSIQGAGIGIGVPPPSVVQLAPSEQTTISIDIGTQSTNGGSYRIGEVNGRFYGCRNANQDLLGWLSVTFSAGTTRGTAVALTAQYTSNCSGSDWQGGAPSGPIIAHYCIR